MNGNNVQSQDKELEVLKALLVSETTLAFDSLARSYSRPGVFCARLETSGYVTAERMAAIVKERVPGAIILEADRKPDSVYDHMNIRVNFKLA